MQTASLRVWTQIAVYIPNLDELYITSTLPNIAYKTLLI